MATISVGKGSYIRPVRNTRIVPFPEAASQTFRVGDVLILQTSADKGNQVKITGADPSAGTVVGIAMAAASGVENTEIPVAVLDEQGEFYIHVQDTGVIDADDIGDEYGIVADATNLIYRLDLTETTAKVFRIVRRATNPATGLPYAFADVNGAWICTAAAGVQGVFRK
ncbi:MAG: hypothetical protein ABL982_00025 [Vicinamibacterales bacterium]